MKQSRLLELDVLRGLAACGIMLYHYIVRYDQIFKPHTTIAAQGLEWGHLAVSLFFIISGFVIFMTLERTTRPLDFIVSRVSRLYPAYWASVLTTAIVVTFLALPGRVPTSWEVLVNFTMLQQWLLVPSVDGVYWTLSLELSFYGIMFAIYRCGLLSRIEMVAVWWLGLQAVITLLIRVTAFDMPAIIATTFLFYYAHLFLAGIVFFRIRQAGLNPFRMALLTACLGIHTVCFGALEAGFVATMFGIFLAMVYGRLGWIVTPPLVFLGAISYSLYLTHQNIGYSIIHALVGWPMSLRIAIAIVVALGLATLLTRWVEQPALQALRARYARFRATASPDSRVTESAWRVEP